MKPKKKFINYRPTLTFVIAIIIAIVLVTKVFVSQTSRLIILCILSALAVVLTIFFFVKKKRALATIVVIVIAMLLPVANVYFKSQALLRNNDLNVEKCEIYGKIYKVNENLDENRVDVYLTDVQLMASDEHLDYYGNFLLRINSNNLDTSKIEIGRYIKGSIKPSLYNLSSGESRDLSFISRDITGFAYAYSYNVTHTDKYDISLRDSIKTKVYKQFQKTDLFFTNVGYAMMFGDSSVIDDSVYGVFENSGTVHLLAVSGFHVSVIVGFILFLLKKLRANKCVTFIVSAVILLFYAYLCDFSVSIVRAIIMSMIIIYASMRNKECDRLSSMCLACLIILLLNPLDLYNISFVLSFVSVLSILLLMPVIQRFLSKFIYNKLASALSLTIAISLGMTTFQLYYFGKAPILSVLSNVITVPIVSVLFVFIILAVILGSVFGIAPALIAVFGHSIKYVLQFNNWIAGIGLFLKSNHVREIMLVLTILIMYSVSDYLFVRKKNRIILLGLLGGLLMSLLIF